MVSSFERGEGGPGNHRDSKRMIEVADGLAELPEDASRGDNPAAPRLGCVLVASTYVHAG